jgi:hypothetical protein
MTIGCHEAPRLEEVQLSYVAFCMAASRRHGLSMHVTLTADDFFVVALPIYARGRLIEINHDGTLLNLVQVYCRVGRTPMAENLY